MPMVIVGVLLLVAKMADFGVVGGWSWWVVLAPFAAAVVWWQFSDSTGLTKRRAIDRMEQRKADRRERAMEALGLDAKRDKRATRSRADAARRAPADPPQGDQRPSQPPR